MTDLTNITSEMRWKAERLWGAKEIANFAGVSVDTVYRWSDIDDCPIKKLGGKYFSTRSALVAWICATDAE